ncbi:MAG TPA: hypothetical protein VFQ53_31860 [Kofleriaceae bacterium]|nr:hypothetical protein [Kofleriaceae bacterium]
MAIEIVGVVRRIVREHDDAARVVARRARQTSGAIGLADVERIIFPIDRIGIDLVVRRATEEQETEEPMEETTHARGVAAASRLIPKISAAADRSAGFAGVKSFRGRI